MSVEVLPSAEFLTLNWAAVDNLKHYLYGADLVVRTGDNLLTHVLTIAKLDDTRHRCLAALSGFQFSMIYHPGVGN